MTAGTSGLKANATEYGTYVANLRSIDMTASAIKVLILLSKVFFRVSSVIERQMSLCLVWKILELWMTIFEAMEVRLVACLASLIGNRFQVVISSMMLLVTNGTLRLYRNQFVVRWRDTESGELVERQVMRILH